MTYDRNIQAYRETDLQTMGKERLIVLLYRAWVFIFPILPKLEKEGGGDHE